MNVNRRNSKTTNLEKYSCLSWGSSSDERDPEMSKRLIKIEAGVWPDLVGQVRQTLIVLVDSTVQGDGYITPIVIVSKLC